MWPNPQVPADLVTFTEEILNEKLHFFVQCPLFKNWNQILRLRIRNHILIHWPLKGGNIIEMKISKPSVWLTTETLYFHSKDTYIRKILRWWILTGVNQK